MNCKIGISILNSDLLNIRNTMDQLTEIGVKDVHIDIADTSFVPNISIGPSIVNEILKYEFSFDIHLMVSDPLLIIKMLDLEQRDVVVTIHCEILNFEALIAYTKINKIKLNIAINPDTEIEMLEKFVKLSNVNMIMVMTVYPGFGGQKLIGECIEKAKTIKERYAIKVGIDGGVNLDNISDLRFASYIVVGSFFFNSEDKKECYKEILRLVQEI